MLAAQVVKNGSQAIRRVRPRPRVLLERHMVVVVVVLVAIVFLAEKALEELLRAPGNVACRHDQRARLAWFLHNSHAYNDISRSDIQFLKCFLGEKNNCNQDHNNNNHMSLKQNTRTRANSTDRLGTIFHNLGSKHACGVQVMRTSEEVNIKYNYN